MEAPTRVVFFLQGWTVPAARARGFVVARALQARGVVVELRVPRPSVYGDTSLPWPLNRARGLFRPFAALVRLFQVRGLGANDVAFFQRPLIEYPTAVLERWTARGRPSIFDFDDAIFLDFGGRAKLKATVRAVDHVIAGNRYLAEAAGAPEKTTVIPTIVDTDRFPMLPTRDRRGRDVVVGWTGLRGNYRQLLTAKAGIAAALAKTGARLLVISNAPPPAELRELPIDYRPWRAETEIADLAEIDVG
ncbi:MAG: hypothetical protein ABUS79_15190, partial [Pseudomonadota bacterium]